MINNRQKALIHVAKRQTGLTDEEYRAMLAGFGVNSSTELDYKAFCCVMDHFKKLGFKSRNRKRPGRFDNLPDAKRNLMRKLEAIILDMKLSWGYVDKIAKKSFGVDKAYWLEPKELFKLVQIMAVYQKKYKQRIA